MNRLLSLVQKDERRRNDLETLYREKRAEGMAVLEEALDALEAATTRDEIIQIGTTFSARIRNLYAGMNQMRADHDTSRLNLALTNAQFIRTNEVEGQ